MVWKSRWSWWCGSHGEGGAVSKCGRRKNGVVVSKKDVLILICGYAPKSGRSFEEKQSFYDELKYEWHMHYPDDLVVCLGDINGHIGRNIDGFDGIHGGYGVGQRN